MDVHRLRTVNFSKKISEKHVAENKVSQCKESRNSHISKSKLQNASVEGHHNNSKQQLDTKIKEIDPAIETKSKILHSRIKEDFRKPSHTSSLDDFRKKSHNDIQANIKVKQRNKPRSKTTKQRDFKTNEKFRNTDDIDIVYSSEEMKGMLKKDSKQKNLRKPKSIHVRKSSTELFSTPSVSRLRNNVYMYYQTCKLQNASKRKRKRPVTMQPCFRDTYPLDIKTSSRKQKDSEDRCTSGPLHFNTIDYSTGDKVENFTQQSRHDFSNLYSECQTLVSPKASIVVPMACGDDACQGINEAIDTDHMVTLVAQRAKAKKGKKGKIDDVPPKYPCLEDPSPYSSPVKRFFNSLIKGLKTFLLVLTVIAWSPCIIIVFLCWAIITPLTPEDIMAAEEIPSCPKCRNKFFSKVVQCVTRMYNKVMYTFEAVKRSLNVDEEDPRCTGTATFNRMKLTSRRRCGGLPLGKTTKQYLLYYAENKGWLVKPMQTPKGIFLKQRSAYDNENNIPKSRGEKTVTFWDSAKGIQDDDVEKNVENENNKTTVHDDKPSFYEIKSPCICPEASQTPTSESCDCDHRGPPHVSGSFEREHTVRPCQHTGRRAPPVKPDRITSRRNICLERKRLDHQLPCPGRQRHSPCTCKPKKPKPPKIRICKCPKKKKKKKKHSKSGFQKITEAIKKCFTEFNNAVNSAEEIWGPSTADCQTLYLHTLRKRPCFWVYNCCPKMYPAVLTSSKMLDNCCHFMLYVCSACVWCPIFLCCYLCYILTCQLIDCC